MIVHRDYRSSSDSIVKVFDNKIEFYNPGRLPDSITVDDLLANNYKSTPRNKLIADFFKNLGLIEKYGSGIRRIIDSFVAEDLQVPEFRNISDGFMVTVFSKYFDGTSGKVGGKVGDEVGDEVGDDLTDNQKKIIEHILSNSTISARELSTELGISQRKIEENISKLKGKGIIKRLGTTKRGHWKIITKTQNKS